MPFQAVTSRRLYEQVADQIAELIARGEFQPGDRLPAERDLSAKLGVSRPTVREAMIALEIAGLVEVRVGAGTIVLDPRDAARTPVPIDAGTSPSELIAARLMIEPEVAATAARLATPAERTAITDTLALMQAAPNSPAHRDADRMFHRRIAEATGNDVIVAIVEQLWTQMFTPLFDRLGRSTGLIPQAHDITLAEHRLVANAIAAGDADAAARAMTNHLAHVQRILSDEPDTVLEGAAE